jgi:uncharacterized membrane protein YagU involved in acid resistance
MKWSTRSAVLIGGAIAGTLDILFAITFAYSQGVPPMNLLQTVASGVLGKASYEGGAGAATLGLALHFLISLLFAAGYVLASRRVDVLTKHPVVVGAVFGIGVFLMMRLVVLPLSAFPHPVTFRPLATVLDLLSHMFFFGVPIALAARKAAAIQQQP